MTGADEARRDAATDSVTFAFGDLRAERYGLARIGLSTGPDGAPQGSALAVLFAGREPVAALARGAVEVPAEAGWDDLALDGLRTAVDVPLSRWSVAFDAPDGQGFALDFEAVGDPASLGAGEPAARLGGMAGYEQPCRVRGTVRAAGREHAIDALGQRGHSWGEPDWDRIELARTVTAWTDGPCAALTAIRPAGAATTPTRRPGRRCGSPSACCRSRTAGSPRPTTPTATPAAPDWSSGRPASDEWARRAAGEVRAAPRSTSAPAAGLRVLPVAPRAGRASAATTSSAGPRRSRRVVSDFGGVLTAPLMQRSRAPGRHRRAPAGVRRRAGARRGDGRGRNPLFELEVGRITEAEFLATLERELAGASAGRSRCTASASATWPRSTPNARCSPTTARCASAGCGWRC